MIEILLGSLITFLIAGALLSVGQWFGRPPISGKCSPDDPACCMNQDGRRCDRGEN